jgi:arylsulfatase A-like enzyme
MVDNPNVESVETREILFPHRDRSNHGFKRKPNFLILMTDAQRCDTLGCYGNRVIQTPHIDALSRSGARFDQWFVPNPICEPARVSLVTGQMPSSHGVRCNGINLQSAAPNAVELLRRAGYQTGGFGKLHFSPWGTSSRGESAEGIVDWEAGQALPAGYMGLDVTRTVLGHSEYSCGDYRTWLDTVCPSGFALLQMENALKPPSGALCTWDSALPVQYHHSPWVADQTIEFLRMRDKDRPFLALCSFPDPHMSYCPPEPYCSMYGPSDVPPPLWREGELDLMPPHFKTYYEGTGYLRQFFESGALNMRPAKDHTELQWRDMNAHYWGMVSLIDQQIGRLLHEVEALSLAEDTVIIFVPDHGALMGDHGMHMHGPYHYDAQIRVPCIWSWLGAFPAGRVCSDLAGTIDIAPTILDIAGITPPFAMQGRSLASYLMGGTPPARQAMLVEYDDEYFGPFVRTLVTPGWKLTRYAHQTYGELFNVQEDPQEFHNRWDDLALQGIRTDLERLLLDEMMLLAPFQQNRVALHG